MAYALEKITSDRTIEAPEDLSEYGLDEPQCTVDIAAGEDSYQLLIGDRDHPGRPAVPVYRGRERLLGEQRPAQCLQLRPV